MSLLFFQADVTKKVIEGAFEQSWLLGTLIVFAIAVIAGLVRYVFILRRDLEACRNEIKELYDKITELQEKTLTTLSSVKDVVSQVNIQNQNSIESLQKSVDTMIVSISESMKEIRSGLINK